MDAMVDGNRRVKSTVGVINQRYIFALVGNANALQVVSNYDRFQRSVPFPVEAGKWYRLKTQIDIQEDGTGLVRAKAWPRESLNLSSGRLKRFTPNLTFWGHQGFMPCPPKPKEGIFR